jgi:cytochrome c-type biogenesis protein CcmE
MNKKIQKRFLLILTLLVVGGALISLVFSSFTGALVYFYTPTEILQKADTLDGQKVRIGGMVQEGSLVKESGTLKIKFLVTDGEKFFPVRYDGMLPDLFREGQGVIVEGTWKWGQDFMASSILAKHSEDYMPIEMTEEGITKAKKSILQSMQ